VTYINQRQNSDNRPLLVVYLFFYFFIFKTPGIKKTCLKRFHSNVDSDMIWNFSTLWKQSDSISGKKNRIHLYDDWHSREETVKSCRLNPPVCKLLRFVFNFTMMIFVASS